MKNCHYCETPAQHHICIAKPGSMKIQQQIGNVCDGHVVQALAEINSQCFGLRLWPCVADLNHNIIFHGFRDADQRGYAVPAGWEEFNQ